MTATRLAGFLCLAASVVLPSCAPQPPPSALSWRYAQAVRMQRPSPPIMPPVATASSSITPLPPMRDGEEEQVVLGQSIPRDPLQSSVIVNREPALEEIERQRYSESTQASSAATIRPEVPAIPAIPRNDNFDRCIGGLLGCTPGMLTMTQRALVTERWGPRDYTHCPAGWTDCDMSRRTPSSAEADRQRGEAARARSSSQRSYGGYGGGGYSGGGCGSRGGPGYRLSNGKCASWRDGR